MLIRSYRAAFVLLFTALLVLTTAAVAFNAYRRAAEVSLGLSADIIDQMSAKVMERTLAIFDAAYADLEINAFWPGMASIPGAQGAAPGRPRPIGA